MKEIKGDLIELANKGEFDVITHGCNCFCTMGAGIAVAMKENFGCSTFQKESIEHKGDINKLGTIDYGTQSVVSRKPGITTLFADFGGHDLIVVNSYTQFHYGKNHYDGIENPIDYEALTLCMRKINHIFKSKSIGLPTIGAGLAGGDWDRIKKIIETELCDMDVTIVHYKQ